MVPLLTVRAYLSSICWPPMILHRLSRHPRTVPDLEETGRGLGAHAKRQLQEGTTVPPPLPAVGQA